MVTYVCRACGRDAELDHVADAWNAAECAFCGERTHAYVQVDTGAILALVRNLGIAAALCRAWHLGMAACSCDVGPSGPEWEPGMGVAPEAIEDRVWSRDDHPFRLRFDSCLDCTHVRCAWIHKTEAKQDAELAQMRASLDWNTHPEPSESAE